MAYDGNADPVLQDTSVPRLMSDTVISSLAYHLDNSVPSIAALTGMCACAEFCMMKITGKHLLTGIILALFDAD